MTKMIVLEPDCTAGARFSLWQSPRQILASLEEMKTAKTPGMPASQPATRFNATGEGVVA